jgi:hypothetical protein
MRAALKARGLLLEIGIAPIRASQACPHPITMSKSCYNACVIAADRRWMFMHTRDDIKRLTELASCAG